MRVPFTVIIVCAAVIVLGLLLESTAGGLGVGVTMLGIVSLSAFLIYANVRAWRSGQGDAWDPGRARREARAHDRRKRRGG